MNSFLSDIEYLKQKGCDLHLKHMSAHVNDTKYHNPQKLFKYKYDGNYLADLAAKDANRYRLDNDSIEHITWNSVKNFYKRIVKGYFLDAQQTDWMKKFYKTDKIYYDVKSNMNSYYFCITHLNMYDLRIIYQLIFQKIPVMTHICEVKTAYEDIRCELCQIPETIDHWWGACPQFNSQRLIFHTICDEEKISYEYKNIYSIDNEKYLQGLLEYYKTTIGDRNFIL